MLIKVKSAVSWMRARLSAISLADIQKHLAKIIILAPMAVLLIYLAIFSQPRYMSESKVAIKRSDDLNSGSMILLLRVPLTPVPQKMRCI